MRRRALYILIGVTLVLLSASCGQQHQAKQVIQEFVDQNVTEPSARSAISIVKFDSTKVLNDSVISLMRTNADTIKRYVQKPIKYAPGGMGRMLYVARISYTIYGQEFSDTYYLDEQLTRVVAFKSNGEQEK